MTAHDLDTFFSPRGVALVGARRSAGFGYGIPIVLKRQGWGSRLYLVNPVGGELHGLPVYGRIADVPDPVDLAVLIVPAAAVTHALDEAADRGIRHVIIESAGFAEIGGDGRALQDEAKEAARKRGVRVIGPNCVGVVNANNRFTTVEIIDEALEPGATAIIAQSGVFGTVLLDLLHQYRLRISKVVTLGNRMDVDECEVLEYLLEDPATRVIMMYLEGAANGRALRETLARETAHKPVLLLKSGRTSAGREATASHTASLSGEDEIYDAVFKQSGAVRASSLEELVEMVSVFSTQPLPHGNRLGIVTSSGSLGVMATDAAVAGGLEVPPLARSTAIKISEEAPGWINVRNPMDVGPSRQYERSLTALLEDPEIDMVLAITIIPFAVFREITRMGATAANWFGDIARIKSAAPEKPLAVCAVGHDEFVLRMREISGTAVPVFISPEPAVKALAALHGYRAWKVRQGK